MIANILSCSRFLFALCFFQENPYIRTSAIFCAMISDILDGYIARRFNQTSKLGTLLDPISDKFFVVTALFVFASESRLEPWEIGAFLSRELALILFTAYLWTTKKWASYEIRAFIAGKVMTSLQFLLLIALAMGETLPVWIYTLMLACGAAAFCELLWRQRQGSKSLA